MGGEEEQATTRKVKKDKKDKKEKKRKRQEDDEKSSSSNKLSKEERKAVKAKKKEEKEAALAKVPKADEHGIAYTKIQIKRMAKRVKRGLPPVPTEEEEIERIKRLKQEEKETQNELAGMLHQGKNKEIDDGEENESGDDDYGDNVGEDIDTGESMDDGEEVEPEAGVEESNFSPQQKKARSKPVPTDYVCYACKNLHLPLHWIYDCPDKVHKPGTNQKKKKLRGMNDPSSRKVFVSGLPFEVKAKEVEAYFENEMKCGKVVHCKLVLFPDTKRCKGNGFVTFDTDEGAKKALALNGTTFSIGEKAGKAKKDLKLGVKKVLNRSQTKK